MCAARCSLVLLAVAMLLVASAAVQADVVAIVNPSFENPTPLTDLNDETGLCATPTGWTWTRPEVDAAGMFNMSQTSGPGPHVSSIPDGSQAVWANRSSLHQVLSESLKANTTYTLTAYAGARNDLNMNQFGDSDPTIRLGYGDTYGANLLSVATSNCPMPAKGAWNLWTVTYQTGSSPAGLGEHLRIELNMCSIQPLFDNVSLTATTVTPEPSSLVLVASSLIGLLAYTWRKLR
jgi:hypothetical protein